jgi:osmotically-inducible protein OsmY
MRWQLLRDRRAAPGGGKMRDASRVQDEILKIINDDPTIEGAGHIFVSVEKKGVWPRAKEVVVLKGNVRSESDRVKAEKVAALHAAGREIVNAINVHA